MIQDEFELLYNLKLTNKIFIKFQRVFASGNLLFDEINLQVTTLLVNLKVIEEVNLQEKGDITIFAQLKRYFNE